ncbi:MAG: hypothetical protein U0787_13830 [Polyangia bacterium]
MTTLSIPPWLSDLLCCLSTGGSHTGADEVQRACETVMSAERPLLLMSIEDIASRSDLLDRTIVLTLPTIPDNERRTKEQVWEGFRKAHPRILGHCSMLPRMRADVARCEAGRTAANG